MVARTLWGEPWATHHEGRRWRRRRHDGRWAKLDKRSRLPPHWQAARRRKDGGAIDKIDKYGRLLEEVFTSSAAQVTAFAQATTAIFALWKKNVEGAMGVMPDVQPGEGT